MMMGCFQEQSRCWDSRVSQAAAGGRTGAPRVHQAAKFILLSLAPWKEEHKAAGEVSPQEMV